MHKDDDLSQARLRDPDPGAFQKGDPAAENDADTDPDTPTKEKDDESVIDTSKMSEGERAALEMAEAARDRTGARAGFAGSLFMGRPAFSQLVPFPGQSDEDRAAGKPFLDELRALLDSEAVDPDAIDREGEIPDEVIRRLASMGAFGIKIPEAYQGLGLSQTNYARAAIELGSCCGNLTALLSAHQSIGVPQPLILFGTEEQKERYLPRVARGEISAFALTEPEVGSDPARMSTTAEPDPDGETFVLNGVKLWCTNGTKAGLIVVMARTPSITVNGREKPQVTAFIVEMNSPGLEVVHRCRFMGLRSLYNAVLHFHDVRVPRANIILGEGKGLKVALTTLNTGRITLPAACAGLARKCLDVTLDWANAREQWGAPIGKHAAIADKIARMAAGHFAIEAMTFAVAGMVDRDKKGDIRIEAAMAKLWGTERAWQIVDDTMQIRGGRGYETADSLRARGDDPIPVERWMRDSRINTIFEGSSEIMRLFIAREALDPHLKIGAPVLNTTLPGRARVRAAGRSGLFYAGWYPKQWLRLPTKMPDTNHAAVAKALRTTRHLSRKLARSLFHAMLRFGPKLDKQQVLLGRFVDIGTELFALSASAAYADWLIANKQRSADDVIPLLEYLERSARLKIDAEFEGVRNNADKQGYRLAQRLLAEKAKA